MADSRELIKAIVDEDFVTAKQIANDMLFANVGAALDGVRQEVAADLFDDSVNEGLMAKADFDRDGSVETSKAEVLGSRINAAVKSGKMSPAQAATTKNKGKYR